MKIFITGSTGFLGSSFVEHYTEIRETVYAHTRDTDIVQSLDDFKPDLVIHCAAEIYNHDIMIDSNILLTHHILEWLRQNPKTRMIQIGSSSEYGQVGRATAETDRINPADVYQATKGAATLLCQAYSRQYKLQIAVARIYSGYGAHERERRLFPTLYRAFFNDEPMKLYEGVHDFIYIQDFLRGIDLLLNKDWPAGEIVNFGSGVQTTNSQVLAAWRQITGKTAPVEITAGYIRPFDSTVWCCDTAYAKTQYGFAAKYDLISGITDFITRKHERIRTRSSS